MRKLFPLLFTLLLLLTACKKDSVDASSTKSFQSSINDMATSLTTIQQIKFNEALFILKTFGVEGKDDQQKLQNLAKLLDGKKVPEILKMADQVAQQNNVTWSSTAPPSLGEMNIFGNDNPEESDPNDVTASSLSIITRDASSDSLTGPKAMVVIPRLVDDANEPIEFTNAALETVMEVQSSGNKISTSKNLMIDNHFKGFTIHFNKLPVDLVVDNKIDIILSVKTAKKTYKMSKYGVLVNPKAFAKPVADKPVIVDSLQQTTPSTTPSDVEAAKPTNETPKADPKATVSKFLNNLNAQNLKAAYESANNPNWSSYDAFSNANTGFGSVKNIAVKSVATKSSDATTATVNATYDVTDKSGKTTPLQVTFGMKNVNGDWKISSYKIN